MAIQLSDTNILSNILNIGRRRERSIYYRPDGTPTSPLPADAYSKMYYLSKGFTLQAEKKVSEGGVACPLCEFIAKDAFGLSSHLRKHTKEESIKEEIK